jgi:hypothetical protein
VRRRVAACEQKMRRVVAMARFVAEEYHDVQMSGVAACVSGLTIGC